MADKPLEITVDLSRLTFGDLRFITGGMPFGEIPNFLARVIEGGADDLPLDQWGAIVDAVWAAVRAAMNPTDGAGKNLNGG